MEIDLLRNYPKTKRDILKRAEEKTEEDRAIARAFGKEFFDGPRKYGYGGYHYHPRFWQKVVLDLQDFYDLQPHSTVLDIGAAKGYLLYDLVKLIPGITVKGIDISSYAIENAPEEIKSSMQVADARNLPFPDNSFDLVLALNVIHNFEGEELKQSLREIQRVSRKYSFIVVDAYRREEEKKQLYDWVLTARTILHVDEWKALFKNSGYRGDFFWFTG